MQNKNSDRINRMDRMFSHEAAKTQSIGKHADPVDPVNPVKNRNQDSE